MDDLLGQLKTALAERYRIERELGRGGMARVYLAHEWKYDRDVAVKVLRPELAAVLGRERFLREIRITARLQHPNILPLFDSGDAGGALYYVMPYVQGETLRDRLRREQQLPVDEALRITREVADALACAHHHGIMHRDIKPANILLEAGHALVTDFGLARALTEAAGDSITSSGLIVGTPGYMSPEQSLAEGAVDARSDVYSLGCVLYEMLVGEAPYTGPTAQAIIAKQLNQPVPSARVLRETVPPAVDRALQRALAKAPADRFPTAREFADALATGGDARLWNRPVALIALAALLAGTGVTLTLLRRSSPGEQGGVGGGRPVVQVGVLPILVQGGGGDSGTTRQVQDLFVTELARYRGLAVVDPVSLRSRLPASALQGVSDPVVASRQLGLPYVVRIDVLSAPGGAQFSYVLTETGSGSIVETGAFTAAPGSDLPVQVHRAVGRFAAALEAATGGLAKGLDVAPFIANEANPAAVRAFLEGIDYTYKFLPGGGEHFRRALDLAPDFIAARVFLISGLAAAGDTAAAWEHLEVLRSLKPKATAFEQALIGWSEAVVRGDREAKIRHSRVGLGLAPRNNFSLYDMSEDLWTLGRSQEAVQPVREAMESGWRFSPLYTLWGKVAAETGELAGLRDTLKVALGFAPPDPYLPGVLEALALFEADTGAARQYAAAFRAGLGEARLAQGYADLTRTYRSLAQHALERGSPTTAASLLRRVMDAGVQSRAVRLELARVLAGTGNLQGAESYFRTAVAADLDRPDLLALAGEVAQLLGRTGDARRYFTKYLEIAANGPDAVRIRDRLRALGRLSGPP